jgi:hypothetical protein
VVEEIRSKRRWMPARWRLADTNVGGRRRKQREGEDEKLEEDEEYHMDECLPFATN